MRHDSHGSLCEPELPLPAYGEPVCRKCGEPLVKEGDRWVALWQYRYNALGREATITDATGATWTGELLAWGPVEAVVRTDEGSTITGSPVGVVVS